MIGPDLLARLDGAIDLARTPFTEAESRLLVTRQEDGLVVSLAEYEIRSRDRIVASGLGFVSADGTPVQWEARAGADRIAIETAGGSGTVVFETPERLVVAPPAGLRVRLVAASGARRTGAGLVVPQDGPAIRAVRIGPAPATGQGSVVVFPPGPVTIAVGPPPSGEPGPTRDRLEADARRRWLAWLGAAPPVADRLGDAYARALWVLRVNQIRVATAPGAIGIAPSKQGYVAVWNWDSYFHAIGLRHVDPVLAAGQIRMLLDRQLPNGMLPDVLHDLGTIASIADLPPNEQETFAPWLAGTPGAGAVEVTKPPLTAWAALRVHERLGDVAFLREVYEPILRSQRWWLDHCDPDGNGLYEYRHPFTHADNSPMWDGGGPLESPDLTAYLAMQWSDLAEIADILGLRTAAAGHREAAGDLTARLVRMRWDSGRGLFRATVHGADVPVETPFNLMPIVTGRLPRAVAERTVQTLLDPARFWTRHPVPTVAANDPAFTRDGMWRGPVWMNVNRLLVEGLERSGFQAERDLLAARTLELALTQPEFLEYWDPIGEERPPHAAGMFSWSAATFVDLAVAEATGASPGA